MRFAASSFVSVEFIKNIQRASMGGSAQGVICCWIIGL